MFKLLKEIEDKLYLDKGIRDSIRMTLYSDGSGYIWYREYYYGCADEIRLIEFDNLEEMTAKANEFLEYKPKRVQKESMWPYAAV